MTDNELFNHFKTQSTTFEEMPGEDLWAKIESGLNNTKPTRSSNILLFIACGILVTALTTWYFITTESVAKISPAIEPVTTTAPEPKNIAPLKPQLNVFTSAEAPAERTTSTQTPVILNNTETVVTTATDSVKKTIIRTAKIKTVSKTEKTVAEPYVKFMSHSKGAVAPLSESPTFEVEKKETIGSVVITTKQKITTAEYNQLIADMLNEYETSIGSLLTIKAPGHKPFRIVIQYNRTETLQAIPTKDSLIINLLQPNAASPSLIPNRPILKVSEINPDTIYFKSRVVSDSLPATKQRLTE
ncbi:MAG: hypothetical protein DI539_15845 [Flavobacterium psychrophilum]|nr:MAG: hypothetical protein DI539_15845 [Flavobacterium psychrophilum]